MHDAATLYIHGRQLVEWRVLGPSLVVKVRHKSEQMFPLRRLRKVVFIGQAPGNTRHLWKLLELGIGVNFLGGKGRLVGAFHAPASRDPLLALFAERLCHQPELMEWFQQWQDNQRRHLQRELEQRGLAADKVDCSAALQEAKDWFLGLAKAQWLDIAAEFGLSMAERPALQLLERLEALAQPWVEAQATARLAQKRVIDDVICCNAFNRICGELEHHQRRILVQLEMGAEPWI